MYDASKIVPGLVLFAGLVSFPIWYTLGAGKGGAAPELELPKGESKCVESAEYMKAWHMDLLNSWRDAVVRDGTHLYTARDGTRHEMSLTNTCMRCHTEKAAFCDRCHDYAAVAEPHCWDCHLTPEQTGAAAAARAALAPAAQPVAVLQPEPEPAADAALQEPTLAAPADAPEPATEALNKGDE